MVAIDNILRGHPFFARFDGDGHAMFVAAADKLKGAGDINEAIANIMCGEYDTAEKAIEKDDSAAADYYRAVIAARRGKVKEARKLLDSACEKDPALREKALKDIEFVAL